MNKTAADALLWPFTTDTLPPPQEDALVLYAGARLAEGLKDMTQAGQWTVLQWFKPWADALAGQGVKTATEWPGPDPVYDYALVLGTGQRDEVRGMLAETMLRLKEGGWMVVAAANDEGGKRLMDECALLGLSCETQSKYHARIVWARKDKNFNRDVAQAWQGQSLLQPCPATGFVSCPGLFSWDRIDAGSEQLARHMPVDEIKGVGADFGCGTGHLSRALLEKNPRIKKLYCLDADHRAVDAAAQNMTAFQDRVECRWADLTAEAGPAAALDWIIMNPPFHEGRAQTAVGLAFIQRAAASLKRSGVLYMVANNQLPYELELNTRFKVVKKLYEGGGYKIYSAEKKI